MFKDTVSAEINKSIVLLNSTKKPKPKPKLKHKPSTLASVSASGTDEKQSSASPPGTAPSQYEVLEVLLDAVRDPYEYPGNELSNLEQIAKIVQEE